MNLLNSIVFDGIYPQYYNYFPLAVIALFEIVVIDVELLIFHLFWKREFRFVAMVKNEDGYFMGVVAIIVGNILTFIIGMFIYVLIGGSL